MLKMGLMFKVKPLKIDGRIRQVYQIIYQVLKW